MKGNPTKKPTWQMDSVDSRLSDDPPESGVPPSVEEQNQRYPAYLKRRFDQPPEEIKSIRWGGKGVAPKPLEKKEKKVLYDKDPMELEGWILTPPQTLIEEAVKRLALEQEKKRAKEQEEKKQREAKEKEDTSSNLSLVGLYVPAGPLIEPIPPFFQTRDTRDFLQRHTHLYDLPIYFKWGELPFLTHAQLSAELMLYTPFSFVHVGAHNLISEVEWRGDSKASQAKGHDRVWLHFYWLDFLHRDDNVFAVETLAKIVAARILSRSMFHPSLLRLWATDEAQIKPWISSLIKSKSRLLHSTSQCFQSQRLERLVKGKTLTSNRRLVLALTSRPDRSLIPMCVLREDKLQVPPLQPGDFDLWIKPVTDRFCPSKSYIYGKGGCILNSMIASSQCFAYTGDVKRRWHDRAQDRALQRVFVERPEIHAVVGASLFIHSHQFTGTPLDDCAGSESCIRSWLVKKKNQMVPASLGVILQRIEQADGLFIQPRVHGESPHLKGVLDEYERLFFGTSSKQTIGRVISKDEYDPDTDITHDITLDVLPVPPPTLKERKEGTYRIFPYPITSPSDMIEDKLSERGKLGRYRPLQNELIKAWKPSSHPVEEPPQVALAGKFTRCTVYDLSRYLHDPQVRVRFNELIFGQMVEYSLSHTVHTLCKETGPLRSFLDPSVLLDETRYSWRPPSSGGSGAKKSSSSRLIQWQSMSGISDGISSSMGLDMVRTHDKKFVGDIESLAMAITHLFSLDPNDSNLGLILKRLRVLILEALADITYWCTYLSIHPAIRKHREWTLVPRPSSQHNVWINLPSHWNKYKNKTGKCMDSLTKRNILFRNLSFVWIKQSERKTLEIHWARWISFLLCDAAFALHITLSTAIQFETRKDLDKTMRRYLGICCDATFRFHAPYTPRFLNHLVKGRSLQKSQLGHGTYGIVYQSGIKDTQVIKLPMRPTNKGDPDPIYDETRLGFIAGAAGIGPKVFNLELVQWNSKMLPNTSLYDKLRNVKQGLVIHLQKMEPLADMWGPPQSNPYCFFGGPRLHLAIPALLDMFLICNFYSLARDDKNVLNYVMTKNKDGQDILRFIDFGSSLKQLPLPFASDSSSHTGFQLSSICENYAILSGRYAFDTI